MKNRTLFLFTTVAAVALATPFVVYAYTNRSTPILLSIVPEPDAVTRNNYCIMNPFRDREPERVAEVVLSSLRSGNLTVIEPYLDDERKAHVLLRERQFPIQSWRVRDRNDGTKDMNVAYWVTRGNGYCDEGWCETQVTVWLIHEGDRLKVSNYSAVY